MKKLAVVSLALMMFVALTGIIVAMAGDWKPDMNSPLATNIPEDVTNFGGSKIDIKPIENGNRFEVSIFDVKLTPKGGGGQFEANIIRIASGILDAAKASGSRKVLSEYIAEREPENGKIVFSIDNFAKTTGVPIVEHLWGIGISADNSAVKFLILNPNSPWVSYETKKNGEPNLETLAIGIVMCPDGKVIPLKSMNKGKIKCGKHPELADICK